MPMFVRRDRGEDMKLGIGKEDLGDMRGKMMIKIKSMKNNFKYNRSISMHTQKKGWRRSRINIQT